MHQKAVLNSIFKDSEHLKDEREAILTSAHRISVRDEYQWICLARQNDIICN